MDGSVYPTRTARSRPGWTERETIADAVLDCAAQGFLAFGAEQQVTLCNARARMQLGLPPGLIDVPLPTLLAASTLGARAQDAFLHAACSALAGIVPEPVQVGAVEVQLRQMADDRWLVTLESAADSPRTAAAHVDPLTGLTDRAGFRARLASMLASRPDQEPVAVLTIDLDRFKSVNDSLGHAVGDALLQVAAQRLRAAMRQGDVVSRLGSDEFAVAIAPATNAEAAAARLVELLSRPYAVQGHTARVGASAGVAIGFRGLDPEGAADTLLRGADLALYQAKAEGRQGVRLFDPAMQDRARARHALEADLRAALPLRQLELHYQPQVSLATGALIGFEALARWRHPTRGLVPPDQFIPLAEEIGIINELGAWVLHAACREAAAWPGELIVAVNVSAVQLAERERLPDTVAAALAASGLPGGRLEVEITESALVRQKDEALRVLQALRAQGVRVSMDDFGTGYSSLSQLRSFPFDKIKIDRSFVRDLVGASAPGAGAVVRAIAALGASLGMTTTAEGVETPEQEALVRAEACTDMQGYLVSRPVPAPEVRGLIARLTPRRSQPPG